MTRFMDKKYKIGLSIIAVVIIMIIFLLSMNTQSEISEGKFAIYLMENDESVISDVEIISYNKTSHEIKLTEVGFNKIEALEISVSGEPFIIKLNGKEMYNGSFWTSISSLGYSGVVIMTTTWINGEFVYPENSIWIRKGYPSSEFFEGDDPRNNSEIFDYFQSIGKLIQ